MPSAVYAQSAAKMSNQQLDSLTAPIALYPDALLAQVLMAATFPQDVEAAAQWSKANSKLQGDDAVKAVASEPWDPSVQSLVAFPQVLATMASKPDWVSQLGTAFLGQPNDVMDSVQRLRKQAQAAGNLKTSSQQKVVVEQSTIQIVPANPQVVYVPTYNPTVVYGTWPYPAYPPVYVPPPPGYAIASGFAAGLAFGAGIAVANSLWGGFNWNTHDVNINVNRYNNINVNNRLNVNSSTTNWNRNANVNRNVNNANVNRNVNNNLGSAQRDAYRGRDDAARAQAQQTLQNRTGQNMSGSASQRVQGIHQGGTQNANLQNRAQNANRDNALRGAGDGNTARQDTQRGQASRNAATNRSGNGGLGANGGGQQRTAGGLGANGGGVQRGGGGGGGGRLGGGGGGERHPGRNR
jgi:Predicted membrane protein